VSPESKKPWPRLAVAAEQRRCLPTRPTLGALAAAPISQHMIPQNLLTPTHAALMNRDAESLRVLQEWVADPRFEKVRPDLQTAKMRLMRLEEFVRQANSR